LGTIILREKTELKLNMGEYNGPIYTCSNIYLVTRTQKTALVAMG